MYIGCDPLGPCPRGVRRFPRLAQHLEPVDQPMRSTRCTGTPWAMRLVSASARRHAAWHQSPGV